MILIICSVKLFIIRTALKINCKTFFLPSKIFLLHRIKQNLSNWCREKEKIILGVQQEFKLLANNILYPQVDGKAFTYVLSQD